jgi:putative copper export protein
LPNLIVQLTRDATSLILLSLDKLTRKHLQPFLGELALRDVTGCALHPDHHAVLIDCLAANFNGHAAAISLPAGLLAMAHVTAASWWVGSLWLLRRACVGEAGDDLVRLVTRFSSLAIRIVASLVVVGVALIVVLVDFDASPWRTDYVQTLALKLAFVAVVLGVAIYNKVQLTPRLPREAAALRRSITNEFAAIGCVLLVTAVLTTYFAPES